MADKPYSRIEQDLKFKSVLDALANQDKRLFDQNEGYLPRIERQTLKTNGRVNKAEDEIQSIKRSRSYITGAIAVLVLIVLPAVAFLAIQVFGNSSSIAGASSKLDYISKNLNRTPVSGP